MNRKITSIALGMLLCIAPMVRAGDEAPDDRDKTIAELNLKVAALEKRVAVLEQLLAPLQNDAQRKVLRTEFEKRMATDAKKYSSAQLAEAESLYQTMNKNWRTDEGKKALEEMVNKYPDVNRTGCAELYLGQVTDGDTKVQHLQAAIDKHGDCLYGDGVQVGAYARYLLGLHYKEQGDNKRAAALFDEMRKDFPYAIDHKGQSLDGQIPKD